MVNCADCLATAVDAPAAIDQTFNVVDGDDIRVWRDVREYTKHIGARVLFLPVPYVVGLGSPTCIGHEPRAIWKEREDFLRY